MLRDAAIILLIFWGINTWQTRNMLTDDGSITITPRQLVSLQGEVHNLFSGEDTRPTLVYFFAPWCIVCRHSIGNLSDLDGEAINVVKIALDYTSENNVARFVKETGVSGPVFLGTTEIKRRFQVPGYPSYYLLDADQRVIGSAMGYSTEWGLKLKTYLAQQ